MALVAFTSTVTAATLRANFDDATTQLTTNSIAGRKDQTRYLWVSGLAVATALNARTYAWTQTDDAEVRVFFVRVTDGAIAATVTGTLTQDEGATEFLLDNTISIDVVAANGIVDSRSSSEDDFRDGSNLDMEKINDNLEAGARDVGRNLAKRYTYGTFSWDLAGVAFGDTAALRQFAIRRPGTNNGFEICGIELVIYSATANTWTVTCSDTSWQAVTLLTTAGVTDESYAAQLVSVDVPSSSADVTFTLSASAGTIVAGYLVVHTRSDRGNQGTSHAGYTPTLIDSSSSTAGSLIDTELTALAAAVTNDTTNDVDLRCECFTVRSLLTGTAAAFRVPSGVRRVHQVTAYAVAAVGTDMSAAVTGTGIVGLSATPTSLGATVRAVAVDTPTSSAIVDDPMDNTDDTIITLTNTGAGTIVLGWALVWFS